MRGKENPDKNKPHPQGDILTYTEALAGQSYMIAEGNERTATFMAMITPLFSIVAGIYWMRDEAELASVLMPLVACVSCLIVRACARNSKLATLNAFMRLKQETELDQLRGRPK